MTGANRLLSTGITNVAGAALRLATSIVTVPLLLHYLGASQFGRWAWLQAVLGLFAAAESAVGTTVLVFAARALREADPKSYPATTSAALIGSVTIAGVAGVCLAILGAPLTELARHLFGASLTDAGAALRVAGAVVFARIAQQAFIAMQQAHGRYGLTTAILTMQTVAGSVALVVAAATGAVLATLMMIQGAVAALGLLTALAASAGDVQRSFSATGIEARLRELARHAGVTLLVTLGTVIFMHADRLVLAPILGAASLGVYATMTAMCFQINALAGAAAQPLLRHMGPGAPSARALDPEGRSAIVSAMRLSSTLAVLLAIILTVIGPSALAALVANWGAVGDDLSLKILAVVYASYSLNAVGFFTLQALGMVRVTAAIVLAGGVLSTLFTAAGAHVFGLRGAAMGNAAYSLTLALVVLAMRKLGIRAREWIRWIRWPLIAMGAWILVLIAGDL